MSAHTSFNSFQASVGLFAFNFTATAVGIATVSPTATPLAIAAATGVAMIYVVKNEHDTLSETCSNVKNFVKKGASLIKPENFKAMLDSARRAIADTKFAFDNPEAPQVEVAAAKGRTVISESLMEAGFVAGMGVAAIGMTPLVDAIYQYAQTNPVTVGAWYTNAVLLAYTSGVSLSSAVGKNALGNSLDAISDIKETCFDPVADLHEDTTTLKAAPAALGQMVGRIKRKISP